MYELLLVTTSILSRPNLEIQPISPKMEIASYDRKRAEELKERGEQIRRNRG